MNRLDHTFAALADPTRRAILARLATGDATVGELAKPFAISLPAISRHLKVLEEASLIENEREGKHRRCRLRPDALDAARQWLDFHQRFWSGSPDKLADHLKNAYENTIVLVQVEDARALDEVPAIAKAKNVDGVFIGPADLSISLGHPGNPGHPDVVAAIDKAVSEIAAAGSSPSTFARSPSEVGDLRKRGFPVAVFSSTLIFTQALSGIVREAAGNG